MREPSRREPTRCWVITDGRIGMTVQAQGLAEAMGLSPRIVEITPRIPYCWLPINLIPAWARVTREQEDLVREDPPDLLIACGRRSAAAALAIKRGQGNHSYLVQIQDPYCAQEKFDLLVVPEHDDLRGPNVLTSKGALSRVTAERLASAKDPRLEQLGQPRVAVLVGGQSGSFRLTQARVSALASSFSALVEAGWSLMITPSRRTFRWAKEDLRQAVTDLPCYFWDGEGDNPYLAMLASADAFIVTSDSVNMICEAASTGKPVHIFALDGGSAKSTRFIQSMAQAGITRPFVGRLESWDYAPLNETSRVAELVAERYEKDSGRPILS